MLEKDIIPDNFKSSRELLNIKSKEFTLDMTIKNPLKRIHELKPFNHYIPFIDIVVKDLNDFKHLLLVWSRLYAEIIDEFTVFMLHRSLIMIYIFFFFRIYHCFVIISPYNFLHLLVYEFLFLLSF
jgi:hypothetical protein